MTWSGGIAEWVQGDTAYISSVFSWNLQKTYMRCVFYKSAGSKVRVGGQNVVMNPSMFKEFEQTCRNLQPPNLSQAVSFIGQYPRVAYSSARSRCRRKIGIAHV